jgi:hypothetical protein
MGFPRTARNLEYLCSQLNRHIEIVNQRLTGYTITETYTPETVVGFDYADHGINHAVMNCLHNHFEVLQGTVGNLSPWYRQADYETKYAIRQLNNICHEMENYILGQRKAATDPFWVRPSQITTWINAPRLDLKPKHRLGFSSNGYDRVLGGVYMHWAQIGKTLMEVFRDEGAPKLTDTICEAITHLQYYSGEFDVEWGNDVVYGKDHPWHDNTIDLFHEWLIANGRDPNDINLSLGHLPLGQVDLLSSFGTQDYQAIWNILGDHLDIYSVEIDGIRASYDYCWSDADYEQQQIDKMKPGYDYSRNMR